MGDKETKKTADPKEDLERYINEMKRQGSDLTDETLHKLLFSPGGSSTKEKKGEEKEKGLDEDFSDALEFIREDLKKSKKDLNGKREEEEVYVDARSHFDPSSLVSSPFSVLSPSMKGSIDPLSPSTKNTMEKMSRVSLYSPGSVHPSYYTPHNGQGPSHSSSLPPPSLPPSSLPPPSLPPPSLLPPVSLPPTIPSSLPPNGTYRPNQPGPNPSPMSSTPYLHQSMPPPIVPNGSYHPNGVNRPLYPPHPIPSPYIPHQMTLPPSIHNITVPSSNGHGIPSTSSLTNPLFPPYVHPHSNQSYPIHPLVSPYPPISYPPSVARIHPKKTTQVQRDTEEMTQFLARTDQLTTRVVNGVPPQMHVVPRSQQIQLRPPQQSLQPVQTLPRQSPSVPSSSLPSSSSHPPSSLLSSSNRYPHPLPSQLTLGVNPQYEKVLAIRRNEEGGEGTDGEGETSRAPRLRKKKKEQEIGVILLPKKISEMTTEELKEASRRVRNEEIKLKLMEKNIEFEEDEQGNILPVEKGKGSVIIYPGDPRFPLPSGKDMAFYIKSDPPPPDPLSQCPSPHVKGLEFVPEIPVCTEGKKKPLLCRGYNNTKERIENPDVFGGKYLELIQGLFHSVNGDPGRVPNASTNGDKWEHHFKEGEEPSGMEVYRDVKGRVWNAEYDYTPIFKQLMEIEERLGFAYDDILMDSNKNGSEYESREKPRIADEVHQYGNVFEVLPGADFKFDSDLSDYDDGRIAIGKEPLKKKEENSEEKRKKKEGKNGDKKDKKILIRDPTKKIRDGYYPLLMSNRFWGKITYNEKSDEVGMPYMCSWKFNKVYVDPNTEKAGEKDRYSLAIFDRLNRDPKTFRVLSQPDSSFYFMCQPGGYVILGSESEPPLFVQSPFYNAMMGEELDTIVRITKGHQMIIFDENFYNLLLQQANEYGEKVLYEIKQLLLTRVSCTKGWGEAYQKSTILDALVWVEINILNPMKKIDTLLGLDIFHKRRRERDRHSKSLTELDKFIRMRDACGHSLWVD